MLLLFEWGLMPVYLEKISYEKNVYIRETFCRLVFHVLHIYRTWFLFCTSLLSPAAIVKKYILGTFIQTHLHVWFILGQYAVDRPNLAWMQRVHFIGSKDVSAVRLIIFVELAFDEMIRWKRKTLHQAGKKTRFRCDISARLDENLWSSVSSVIMPNQTCGFVSSSPTMYI